MTNKNQDPFNSPPRSQMSTPRNQRIPRRATPPPVQRQRLQAARRPQPTRPTNNRARYNRLVNNIAGPSPATMRNRNTLREYIQNLIANNTPGSNRSNQTPLKKNKNNNKK